MEALRAEPGAEDGIDPRDELRQAARTKGGRKTHQLCAQVAEAINYAFAAECHDDLLREMGVVAVQPAPDESRLLVTVAPTLPGPCDPAEVLVRLDKAQVTLRTQVAAGIHRKKVPQLAFRVMLNAETQ